MDELRRLAARLDETAAAVRDAARGLPAAVPPGPACGADAPGRLGEVGAALHDGLLRAVDARVREASQAAGRLGATADAVRTTAHRYADAEQAADRRLRREA